MMSGAVTQLIQRNMSQAWERWRGVTAETKAQESFIDTGITHMIFVQAAAALSFWRGTAAPIKPAGFLAGCFEAFLLRQSLRKWRVEMRNASYLTQRATEVQMQQIAEDGNNQIEKLKEIINHMQAEAEIAILDGKLKSDEIEDLSVQLATMRLELDQSKKEAEETQIKLVESIEVAAEAARDFDEQVIVLKGHLEEEKWNTLTVTEQKNQEVLVAQAEEQNAKALVVQKQLESEQLQIRITEFEQLLAAALAKCEKLSDDAKLEIAELQAEIKRLEVNFEAEPVRGYSFR